MLPACRPTEPSAPGQDPPPPDPFESIAYATTPLPSSTKVLLVAGGDDVANFAAEIVEQRELWKHAGLRDEDIACYFAKPSTDALLGDGEQLAALAPELRRCYSADPATLHAHLRALGRAAPPYLYLYVTGHGLPPLLRWKAGVDDPKELPHHLELRRGEVGRFDRHAIGLEAGDGPGLGEVEAILEASRAGSPPESLVLTPDTLAAALSELPPTTQKIVVLQACFSGGFIERPDDDGPSPLTKVPNITILTATSAARPSFGCDPGAHRTYFGGTFNRVLAQELEQGPHSPPTLPWRSMYETIRFVVETMETIDGERPSQPQMYTNVPDAAPTGAASIPP
ncbi:C13 family peptidase [Paraliomyxa miuraensis]|uniref:C13 family peptidase n=1 Tax=Paraliomyxa miuraensis TaxID=376150 RepID=UPI00224DAE86|nr:C13 family peptidase [Paraliomyxa miuraensis]MCX4243523.1 C13 family peptidase [Paraliomyxa miuraensis]